MKQPWKYLFVGVLLLCSWFVRAQESSPSNLYEGWEQIVGSNPTSLVKSSQDGSLWVGTADRGLFRFGRNGRVLHYTREVGHLSSNAIASLYVSPGNILWVLDASGVVSYYTNVSGFRTLALDEAVQSFSPAADSLSVQALTVSRQLLQLSPDAVSTVAKDLNSIHSDFETATDNQEVADEIHPIVKYSVPFWAWLLMACFLLLAVVIFFLYFHEKRLNQQNQEVSNLTSFHTTPPPVSHPAFQHTVPRPSVSPAAPKDLAAPVAPKPASSSPAPKDTSALVPPKPASPAPKNVDTPAEMPVAATQVSKPLPQEPKPLVAYVPKPQVSAEPAQAIVPESKPIEAQDTKPGVSPAPKPVAPAAPKPQLPSEPKPTVAPKPNVSPAPGIPQEPKPSVPQAQKPNTPPEPKPVISQAPKPSSPQEPKPSTPQEPKPRVTWDAKPSVERVEKPVSEPVAVSEPELFHVESYFMQQVNNLILQHLPDASYGVEEMAESLGISRIHLNRKLKAEGAPSPSNLLKAARMKHAAKLLLESDLPINEIALQCGFSTASYFSTAFKDFYQQTPSEYVAQYRSDSDAQTS